MYLVKRPSGFYHVRYRNDQGKWISVSARTNKLAEANSFFSELKFNLARSKPSSLLSIYREQYAAYSKSNHAPGTSKRTDDVLNRFVKFTGDPPMNSIGAKLIEEYKSWRLKRVSPVRVNIELRTLKAFFSVAGLRRSEIINLRWDDIDLNRRVLFVRNREGFNTKSKRQRIVPLNMAMMNLLQSLPKNEPHVLLKSC